MEGVLKKAKFHLRWSVATDKRRVLTSKIEVQRQPLLYSKRQRLGCRFYNLQEWGWGGYKAFQLKVQYNTYEQIVYIIRYIVTYIAY